MKCLASLVIGMFLAVAAQAAEIGREPPLIAELVAKGQLPPMAERLPRLPYRTTLAEIGREPGRHGGEIRLLMADQRDLRMMSVYGYARLVGFDADGKLQPDILEAVETEEGRSFTLTLREGHRWSDGTPFTTEDFRYWWEDVATNKRFYPGGPPQGIATEGEVPTVTVIDGHRIRYSWKQPNPGFLPALAAAQPLYIMMPAAYMKRFHAKYADAKELDAAVKAHRVRDWTALHEQKSRAYRQENPELPVLDPWRNRTPLPAERFVFERNPFFHRVDERGQQLPYLDRIIINTATGSLVPAKVGAGDADLQARYLRFDNYTFLKRAEERNGYRVRLWPQGEGAILGLHPNLNTNDPVWRGLMRDVRFRRAISHAINRKDINNIIFFGLAKPGQNGVLPGSPLFDARRAHAYASHDIATANRLLDEAGLGMRDSDGVRLLPDGRRAEITVESAGDSAEDADALELLVDDFRNIGLKLTSRASQRDLFRRRVLLGETLMSFWKGWDNGMPSPDMDPTALAPTSSSQYAWPKFGRFVESNGKQGEAIDMPEVNELADLHMRWRRSVTTEERATIWRRMLDIHAEQLFIIGIVNGALQPVVVANELRNVPDKGWFAFEPGAFFGIHRMDAFWRSDAPGGN
ncbi:MAG: ABC transporter substrate-binding protein [Beijerinckiaceae bacterium]